MALAPSLPASRDRRRDVPAGCPLTVSEHEVIAGISEGLTYDQVAHRTSRAPSTVRQLAHTAYRRLGVPNDAQAVLMCERKGWLGERAPHGSEADELARLRVVIGQLVDAVRTHHEGDITVNQRVYLEAFDRHLRATGDRRVLTRARMNAALDDVIDEAGIEIEPRDTHHAERRPTDSLIELIADFMEER